MDTIIAPGRNKYITGEKKEGCIFCADSLRDDRLVLHKGEHCFVIMNKYPYNSGHLMVVPYRHIADIADASTEELMELMNLTGRAVDILRKAFNPQGFNVGMNLGKAAGAGVDEHMHMHVVPRWFGDTNFVTVLGEVRVIPEEIEKTRDLLKSLF